MRLHLQRVSNAQVDVDGETVGKVGQGLLILAGFTAADESMPGTKLWNKVIDKALDLRIFPDAEDKMNLSLRDFGGEVLVVSQFTLYADCKKGRRPSFHNAAGGPMAEGLYDKLVEGFEQRLPGKVQTGSFGAMMDVNLVNWGPVTIMLDSEEL